MQQCGSWVNGRRIVSAALLAFFLILCAMIMPATALSASADDQTLDELRAAIAKADADLRALTTSGQRAANIAASRVQQLAQHRERMQPLVEEEQMLHAQQREAETWQFLHALPAEIDRQLPPLRTRRAQAQRVLESIRQREETFGMAGINRAEPSKPLLEYTVELLHAEISRLERIRATLARDLPNLQPPSWVKTGQTVAEAAQETTKSLTMLHQALNPLREQARTLEASAMEAQHEVRRLRDELDRTRHARWRLLHVLAKDYDPLWLKSVRIEAPKDRRTRERHYYEAKYTEDPAHAALDAEIAHLISALDPVQRELEVRERAVVEAESRFIDVSNRWQEAHARASELQEHAYYWAIGLELADATIGILADGGTPASIFFEAAWRVGEAGLKDYRIDDAPVSQQLLDYRARIARQLTPTGPQQTTGRTLPDFHANQQELDRLRTEMLATATWFESLGARTKAHLYGEQFGEVVKGTTGTVATASIRELVRWSLEKNGTAQDVIAYFDKRIFDPRFSVAELARSGVNRINEWRPLPDRLMSIVRGGDAAGNAMQQADSALKDFGKGVAIGAAVTGAKEVLISWNQNARARVAAEKALLDVEWLLRRHEYQQRNAIYRAYAQQASDLEAAIGEALEEKARLNPERPLTVTINKPFSISDSMRIALEFNHPVGLVTVHAGGRSFSQTFENRTSGVVEVPGFAVAAGDVTLEVEAQSRRFGREIPLDANPRTVARFNARADLAQPYSTIFSGYEGGRDAMHRITVLAPTLTLIDPKDNGYLAGDWLDFDYTMPGSLASGRVWVTVVPVDKPQAFELPVGESGRGQFQTPPMPGAYELIFYQESEANRIASVPFRVVFPLARAQSESRFGRAIIVPLPDRGNTVRTSDRPIAEGHGRLILATRDAAQQLTGPRISIRHAGSEQEVAYTWGANEIDLPAGPYDLVVSSPVPTTVRNINVDAGARQIVSVGATGRLTFDFLDALGERISPRVSIRRAGETQEFTYTWGGNTIDLPPDTYDVVIATSIPIEHPGLKVEAGHNIILTTGGYGRLNLKALDALRQPIGPRVSIRIAGKEEEFTYTWAGNYVDLPPDQYDVIFSVVDSPAAKNLTVTAGQVTEQVFSGYGRLDLKALDALQQPIGPRISIRRAGEEQEFTYTWAGNFIDVPPGRYTLIFSYALGLTYRDIVVEREKVTAITAGNVGRLVVADAPNVNRRISIRHAGTDREVVHIYDGNFIDLPPGPFTGVYRLGNDEEVSFTFAITPNAQTTISVR